LQRSRRAMASTRGLILLKADRAAMRTLQLPSRSE
jgi:hypothetical protein